MTLQQFLDILYARWKTVVLLFVLCAGTAIGVSLLLPKKYTASAQVLVDAKSPDPVLGVMLPGQILPGFMATQVDIVTSQRVALMVVDALRIAENPQAIEQWRTATDGAGSIRHYYSDLLLKFLDVKPSRESSVLNIGYSGADPQFAAVVANAFARAYVELSVELKVEPARQTRGFFDGQTQALRDRLEAAQNRLTAYQRQKGIVSADERLDVETARLAELSTQLTVLQAQTVEAAKRQAIAREARASGIGNDVPEILANPLIQALKTDQARLEARLEQQRSVLGSQHPDILKAEQELKSIKGKIDVEMAAVTGSLGKTYQLQSQREAELKAALDKQRARVLQIKEVRDELTVLQRETETAQRAFDAAGQRLSQTALESQVNQSNVVLLTAATQPTRPSSPKVVMNAALGMVLGMLLGVGSALAMELRNRRVRGTQDLALASGVQPMSVLRNAFRRRARKWARRVGPASRRAPMLSDAGYGTATQPFPHTLFGAMPECEDRAMSTAADAGASPGKVAGGHQPIGQIMVSAGLINPPEVERILQWARADGTRFGEAAVAHKVVTAEQVERALAFQFDYPVLAPESTRVSDEVVAAFDGHNPLVADLRRLRTKIRSAQIAAPADSPLKAFAVISSGSGDGKTFVAANLAVTFSQLGQRTLLIDADLRRGRLHTVFGVENRTGLSSMLNRRIEPGSLQRVPGLRNLSIVTCGPRAPNPSELLSRDVFSHLLESFARTYDVIILDTPGVAEEPDATLVAQRAGAALVLARKDRSAFDAVVELVQSGGTPNVSVLGSVLNTA